MNEFSTYEYVVAEKKNARLVMKKIGFICGYVLFVILWFVFGFATNLFPLLALIPLTTWMLVFFTWRYANVEYEYSVTSGTVTFSKVFGGRSRKQITEFKLKDCSLIAPLSESDEKIKAFAPERDYVSMSSWDTPDAYVALLTLNDKKTAVYFEATEKMLKICRFYNSPCTVIGKVRY